jgi:hypothetical protein
MPGEIGYLSVSEAELYFSTRLEASPWTLIIDDSGKTRKVSVLTTAYNRLFYSGLFDLPTLSAATAEELIKFKMAQCEMGHYMLLHLADEDRRKGIQAQGVTQAGIVQEYYSEANLLTLPIPPIVANLLEDYSTEGAPFCAVKIDRDEDEDSMKL